MPMPMPVPIPIPMPNLRYVACMMRLLACVFACSFATGGCGKSDKSGGNAPPQHKRTDARKPPTTRPTNKLIEPGDPKTSPPPAIVKKHARGDCSTKYAPRPKRDPNPMCKVSGGTFMMGIAKKNDRYGVYDRSRPVHKVTVSPYLIDQFEVTTAQYVLYLNTAGSHTHCGASPRYGCYSFAGHPVNKTIRKVKPGQYAAKPGRESHPARDTTRAGAESYCRWVGKVLVSEAQWEFAARFDSKTKKLRTFPWGDKPEKKRANCQERNTGPWPGCADGFAGNKDGFGQQAPVGSFDGTGGRKDGSSAFGVHDMAGNAVEWVQDDSAFGYGPCPGKCIDPVHRNPRQMAVVRGGDALSTMDKLRGAYRNATRSDGAYAFRCARVP